MAVEDDVLYLKTNDDFARCVRFLGLQVRWTALPQFVRSLTDVQGPENEPPEQAS